MSDTPSYGSDVQETPDWWMASDRRWYPPELHPDYQKPTAPEPPPATIAPTSADMAGVPSLSDRLRDEADRIGQEAATAAGPVRETVAAGSEGAPSGPSGDSRATIPAPPPGTPPGPPTGEPVTPPEHTVIQSRPAAPTATGPAATGPAAPPPAPSDLPPLPPTLGSPPPSAGAPPLPPTLGGPPAPPPGDATGGVTYSSPPPSPGASAGYATAATPAYQPPGQYQYQPPGQQAAPGAVAKVASKAAGAMALIAGIAAVAGSLLQWGKGTVEGAGGVQKATIEVAGFDSNGLLTLLCGAGLLLIGLLFYSGTPKQLYWAIGAFVAGGIIVGAVVFSLIDIADLSDRYAAEWQANGLASTGDIIRTQADIGLWIAGAGGVLGVLAAPFVNRE